MKATVAETDVDVRRLRLSPGEIVVAQLYGRLTQEAALRLRDALRAAIPSAHPILLLPHDVELAAVRPAETPEDFFNAEFKSAR
ncbi:MAG TPA: hypothetical protein VGG29_20905 [Caulobacteraceae bacterium]|jgi:hypothetical protein